MHGGGYDSTIARLLFVYKDYYPNLIAEDYEIHSSQLSSVRKVCNLRFKCCYLLTN